MFKLNVSLRIAFKHADTAARDAGNCVVLPMTVVDRGVATRDLKTIYVPTRQEETTLTPRKGLYFSLI